MKAVIIDMVAKQTRMHEKSCIRFTIVVGLVVLGGGVSGHESRPHATRTEGGVNDDGRWGRMAWLEGRGFVLGWMRVVAVMVEESTPF